MQRGPPHRVDGVRVGAAGLDMLKNAAELVATIAKGTAMVNAALEVGCSVRALPQEAPDRPQHAPRGGATCSSPRAAASWISSPGRRPRRSRTRPARIIFSVVAPRSAASPWRPISMNRSLVMIMPAPSHMSTICCICFCIAAGSAASQSSSAGGFVAFSSPPGAAAASLASFPSSPGVALDILGCTRLRGLWLRPRLGVW